MTDPTTDLDPDDERSELDPVALGQRAFACVADSDGAGLRDLLDDHERALSAVLGLAIMLNRNVRPAPVPQVIPASDRELMLAAFGIGEQAALGNTWAIHHLAQGHDQARLVVAQARALAELAHAKLPGGPAELRELFDELRGNYLAPDDPPAA